MHLFLQNPSTDRERGVPTGMKQHCSRDAFAVAALTMLQLLLKITLESAVAGLIML